MNPIGAAGGFSISCSRPRVILVHPPPLVPPGTKVLPHFFLITLLPSRHFQATQAPLIGAREELDCAAELQHVMRERMRERMRDCHPIPRCMCERLIPQLYSGIHHHFGATPPPNNKREDDPPAAGGSPACRTADMQSRCAGPRPAR